MKTLFYKFLVLLTLILIIVLITTNIKEYFQSDQEMRLNCVNSVPILKPTCINNVESNMTQTDFDRLYKLLVKPQYIADVIVDY